MYSHQLVNSSALQLMARQHFATRAGGLREAMKSAARNEVEGIAACRTRHVQAQITIVEDLYVRRMVHLGVLGHNWSFEVEVEARSRQISNFSPSLAFNHPPYIPPKSPHAVRRVARLSA